MYQHFRLVQSYILKNSGTKDDAKDVYQNTLVAFYQNAGKSDFELRVQLKTYLFSIAKNIWLKEIRNKSKNKTLEISDLEISEEDLGDMDERETLILKMQDSLNNLSENCLKLIRLFHFQNKSWAEIVEIMNYKNEHAARNQKYKCLQKLKGDMNP